MPPCLDAYVVSGSREREVLEQFLSHYVNRAASEDRGNEELMLLPLGLASPPPGFDAWEWLPARTLENILDVALAIPFRAFTVYLKAASSEHYGASLTFTSDGQVILGVSLDDDGSDGVFERAKAEVQFMAKHYHGHSGCVVLEAAPPLSTEDFPPEGLSQSLFTWGAFAV